MQFNPAAILSLLSQFYERIDALTRENEALRERVAELEAADTPQPRP